MNGISMTMELIVKYGIIVKMGLIVRLYGISIVMELVIIVLCGINIIMELEEINDG